MSTENSKAAKPYWQSLDDLADTPEFRAFAQQEFPGFSNVYESLGEAEVEGAVSRRQFIALSAAALGMAGLAGCRRPDLLILPYSRTTDEKNNPIDAPVPGLPTFYATSQPRPGGCLPILVESHEGRPTKIEGNPGHPASHGATDVYAQGSVLDLYSPDRSREVLHKGESKNWEDFDSFASSHFAALAKNKGQGLAFLAESTPSPAVKLVREHIKTALPSAVWYEHEAVDLVGPARAGTKLAFGQSLQPVYHFDKALRVVSIDCDFLSLEDSSIPNSRGYAKARRGEDSLHGHGENHAHAEHHDHKEGEHKEPESKKDPSADLAKNTSRLYVIENSFSVTGTMADHRLRLAATNIADYTILLAKEIASKTTPGWKSIIDSAKAPRIQLGGVWIDEVAKDLIEFKGKSLIVAGHRQPPIVHALVAAMNDALGNTGVTVEYRPATEEVTRKLGDLCTAIEKKEVQTLVVLGGNPVFTSPADLELPKQLAKVPTVIRLGQFVDQTSDKTFCTWHLPMAHYLETWGDAETSDGHYCSMQPLIAPLHGGRSVLEMLIQLSGFEKATSYLIAKSKAYEVLEKSFAARSKKTDSIEFRRFLHLGYLADSAPAFVKPAVGGSLKESIARWEPSEAIGEAAFEVSFHASYGLFDGRYSTNPWLLELPDPITKLVWDNAALISNKTAAKLGGDKPLQKGQKIQLEVAGKKLELPVYILPGQADNSVSISLGFSGTLTMPQSGGGGSNAYTIRTSTEPYFAPAKVCKVKGFYELITTQDRSTIPADRDEVVQEYSLETYDKKVVNKEEHHEGPHEDNPKSRYQYGYKVTPVLPEDKRIRLDVSYPQKLDGHNQWGMVIDLNSCTGCSACVIACQSENNIPTVGKGEVKRNREMHWIRIDRYFTNIDVTPGHEPTVPEEGFPDFDEVRIVTEPMACQHCEGAPCESVCPVNATVHSPEGLNVQVYNRCIGTRYCSNNCPYKVRRFNWFNFNERQIDSLRVPTFLGQINSDGGRDTDSLSPKGVPETLKMQKNPDVTVRIRGVMEKCTYCIQRIERGKLGAKVAAAKNKYAVPKNREESLKWGYDIRQMDGQQKIFSPDGLITPACGQACPTQAIVFGNVNDENSRVYKLKQRQGDFLVLGSRNTKPRTSYLPRLRNFNEKMNKTAKKEANS